MAQVISDSRDNNRVAIAIILAMGRVTVLLNSTVKTLSRTPNPPGMKKIIYPRVQDIDEIPTTGKNFIMGMLEGTKEIIRA